MLRLRLGDPVRKYYLRHQEIVRARVQLVVGWAMLIGMMLAAEAMSRTANVWPPRKVALVVVIAVVGFTAIGEVFGTFAGDGTGMPFKPWAQRLAYLLGAKLCQFTGYAGFVWAYAHPHHAKLGWSIGVLGTLAFVALIALLATRPTVAYGLAGIGLSAWGLYGLGFHWGLHGLWPFSIRLGALHLLLAISIWFRQRGIPPSDLSAGPNDFYAPPVRAPIRTGGAACPDSINAHVTISACLDWW